MMTASPAPRIVALSTRVYLWLLYLCPSGLRREYGPQMVQTYRASCHEAYRRAGVPGVARSWLPTIADVLVSAGAEHTWALSYAWSQGRHRGDNGTGQKPVRPAKGTGRGIRRRAEDVTTKAVRELEESGELRPLHGQPLKAADGGPDAALHAILKREGLSHPLIERGRDLDAMQHEAEEKIEHLRRRRAWLAASPEPCTARGVQAFNAQRTQALDEYRAALTALNRAILSYNLSAPGPMQRRGVVVDRLVAHVAAEIPPLDAPTTVPATTVAPPPSPPPSKWRKAWAILCRRADADAQEDGCRNATSLQSAVMPNTNFSQQPIV